MIPADAVLQRADDVRYRLIGDEAVVIRQQAAEALVLNEVAGAILALLDGNRTARQIAAELGDQFEAKPEVLLDDVRRYLAELEELGIAERAPVDPG